VFEAAMDMIAKFDLKSAWHFKDLKAAGDDAHRIYVCAKKSWFLLLLTLLSL
jgi:hypothetical protein